MIILDDESGAYRATCDECGRPSDLEDVDAGRFGERTALIAALRDRGWSYCAADRVVACRTHAWLALDPDLHGRHRRRIARRRREMVAVCNGGGGSASP